jgi:hypothetical protein
MSSLLESFSNIDWEDAINWAYSEQCEPLFGPLEPHEERRVNAANALLALAKFYKVPGYYEIVGPPTD